MLAYYLQRLNGKCFSTRIKLLSSTTFLLCMFAIALFLSVVFIMPSNNTLLKTLMNNDITLSPNYEEGPFSSVNDLLGFNANDEEVGAGVVGTEEGGSTRTVSPLAVHWQPPVDSCYKKGNDWSACAGDHLHYSSSNPEIILDRDYSCLFEPLCWKQLDWRNSDPPQSSARLTKIFNFMIGLSMMGLWQVFRLL